MKTPNIFIAYTPRGVGLRCAVAYLAGERDVYGWYTGPREDAGVAAAFFLIEDFYTKRPARYDAVDPAELHSRWSLDEARRHDLARMQEAFAHEWLFYRDDPRAAARSPGRSGIRAALKHAGRGKASPSGWAFTMT